MQYLTILIKPSVSHRSEGDRYNLTSVNPSRRCCKHSSGKIYCYLHYRFTLTIRMMGVASAAVLPAINHSKL